MGNIRIYELAKKLKKESKDVVSALESLGVKGKKPASTVEADLVSKVEEIFKKKDKPAAKEKKPAAKKKPPVAPSAPRAVDKKPKKGMAAAAPHNPLNISRRAAKHLK